MNEQLETFIENNQPDKVEVIDSPNYSIDKLMTIRLQHFQITQLTSEINNNFGITNLLNVASTFIWITYTVYSIINVTIQKEFELLLFLSILSWLIVQICRLCALALICNKVMAVVSTYQSIYPYFLKDYSFSKNPYQDSTYLASSNIDST